MKSKNTTRKRTKKPKRAKRASRCMYFDMPIRYSRVSRQKSLQRLQCGGQIPALYTAVIVEPRQHKSMEFVLRNFLTNLEANWNVLIFHGNQNKEWLDTMINGPLAEFKSRISFSNLGVDNLDYPEGYNALLTSKEFYEKIPTEIFLVFQTDSMICPQHKGLLYKFLKYDYVGAPWGSDVGNGGLSLRRKSKMLQVIEKCPPRPPGENEDLYFARNCPQAPLNKPSVEEAKEFSIENIMSPRSFGLHQSYRRDTETIEKQCTGAKTLRDLEQS